MTKKAHRFTLRQIKRDTKDLALLANEINAAHEKAKDAFKSSFEHAIHAGELLLLAKDKVEHGEWLPWLREHCTVSERTAQLYMQVARERPALESATVADLTLRGAAEQLAKPKADDPDDEPFDVHVFLESLSEISPDTPDDDLIEILRVLIDLRTQPVGNILDLSGLSLSEAQAAIGKIHEVADHWADEVMGLFADRRIFWAFIINTRAKQASRDMGKTIEALKALKASGVTDKRIRQDCPQAFDSSDLLVRTMGGPAKSVGDLIEKLTALRDELVGEKAGHD